MIDRSNLLMLTTLFFVCSSSLASPAVVSLTIAR